MKKITSILSIIGLTIFTSCSSKDTIVDLEKELNLYAVFSEDEATNTRLKLWQNDKVTNITDGTSKAYSTQLIVNNFDTYVLGREINPTNSEYEKRVWKNGESIDIPDFTGLNNMNIRGISISGNDLYILGNEVVGSENAIKISKNGTTTEIKRSIATSTTKPLFFVDGDDVYVVASIKNSRNYYEVMMWKNGVETILIKGEDSDVFASDIHVENNKVYVLGRLSKNGVSTYKIWKDGEETNLKVDNISPSDMYVENSNVYITGRPSPREDKALLWKNGELTSIGNPNSSVSAQKVFVKNNKVCVSYRERDKDGNLLSKFWVDGTIVDMLTDKNKSFLTGQNTVFVE